MTHLNDPFYEGNRCIHAGLILTEAADSLRAGEPLSPKDMKDIIRDGIDVYMRHYASERQIHTDSLHFFRLMTELCLAGSGRAICPFELSPHEILLGYKTTEKNIDGSSHPRTCPGYIEQSLLPRLGREGCDKFAGVVIEAKTTAGTRAEMATLDKLLGQISDSTKRFDPYSNHALRYTNRLPDRPIRQRSIRPHMAAVR